jgi:hypothetical protein
MPWKKRRFFPIGYGVEVIGHVNRDALMEQEHVTDPADPGRCQAKNSIGQCRGVKLEGSDYCRLHAGPYRPLGKGIRQYYLVKAEDRTRLAALAEHNDIKSLRDEIGLTRIMIEEIWNSGQSAAERLRNFGAVRLHINDLEKLVKTCNQLEERLGTLLAKPTLLRVGQRICESLVSRLSGLPNYDQLVDVLQADVVSIIQEARNDETAATLAAIPPPAES